MRLPASFPTLLILGLATALAAHPVPDIPVRGSFEADGSCTIRVEVDPRCFELDPEQETYLLKIQLQKLMSPADQDDLKSRAAAFVGRGVEFFYEPSGAFKPEFAWEFTTLGGGPLVNIDDPVVMTGTWRSKLPDGTQGYRIRAADPKNLAVVFENTLRGKAVERVAVLFPGESSFTLDMSGRNATAATPAATATAAPGESAEKPESGRRPWVLMVVLFIVAVAALWFSRLGRT